MDKKILIVDDAMFMRSVIRKTLSEMGYQHIFEAQDGEEALLSFREHQPDLIILDITMPGKSGIEVLEEIHDENPQLKVVMCSAIGQEMMIQKALEAGAVDFIVNPFKKEEFCRVIDYHLV